MDLNNLKIDTEEIISLKEANEKIHLLEEYIKNHLDKNDREKITKILSSLSKSKSVVARQHEEIIRLTSSPSPLATVVKVYETGKEHDGFKKAHYSEFYPGCRVKLSPTYRGEYKFEGTGTIKKFKSANSVEVHFPKGRGIYELKKEVNLDADALDAMSKNTDFSPDLLLFDPILKVTKVKKVIIDYGGQSEIEYPPHLEIFPGDRVKISTKTKQIVGVINIENYGEFGVVQKIIDENYCKVSSRGRAIGVLKGRCKDVQPGDEILLDAKGLIIAKNFGQLFSNNYSLEEELNVSWDDIGGLEEAKTELRELFEIDETDLEFVDAYLIKLAKGVVLFGPPGCGKTLLAKAVATYLIQKYGKKYPEAKKSCFIYIKGPEILSRYVGDAELAVQQIFAFARAHEEKYGFPALIFIDEAEALLRKRGSGKSSDTETTIVPMFLAEMDGLDKSGSIVMVASNRPDILDPAIVRGGRMDLKLHVTRPTNKSTGEIFEIHWNKVPVKKEGLDEGELMEFVRKEAFSEKYKFYKVTSGKDKVEYITLKDLLDGAMVAGFVNKAKLIAKRREKKAGLKPQGLTQADVKEAINKTFLENFYLNHEEVINHYLEQKGYKSFEVLIEKIPDKDLEV